MNINEKYAEILLPQKIGPNLETLTYKLPEDQNLNIGHIVEVSLRNRLVKGIIFEKHNKKPKFFTKTITKTVENAPHLSEWQVSLLKWISEYYFCPLFKSLKLFLPTPFYKKKKLSNPPAQEEKSFELKFKHTLSNEQIEALKTIKNTDKKVSLIHGITGSGKTEVYMHIVEECIKQKKQVLILIPEISLTPQMCNRFESHFHEHTVAIHSKLTQKQKETAWQSIHKGEAKIIIGSRSSIFAPFQNLSHIILDEEHDSCYKQDQSPRYNTLDVAKKISELTNARIILGSATPSLESYYKAKKGDYDLITLITRPTNQDLQLPKAKIIDLRTEIKKHNYSIFSESLQTSIGEKLHNKEQIILFINRRGAASAVICRSCGYVHECNQCDIPMTYHKKITVEEGIFNAERLICHHCGHIEKVPKSCPQCESAYIKFIGLGTQKVEDEVKKLFPEALTFRADRDTTQKRDQFNQIYQIFKEGKADILVGTQMIAIGLHLPKINLVGVILADTGLTIPNFRSSEQTFQLITQVIGRSGREKEGQAIIQTYLPNHYAIQAAANHNYIEFYEQEIKMRKELNQPPFSKLIKLTIKETSNNTCVKKIEKLFKEVQKINDNLQEDKKCEINYYPALIPRLHNQYRWHLLISGPDPRNILCNISNLSNIIIDVDPLSTV